MPNPSEAKKTASAPKPKRKYVLAVILVGVALAIAISSMWPRPSEVVLRMSGRTYALEVARTPSQQEKGLGGRPSMPNDQGMLFTYNMSGRYCYWMEGMQFPLDIMWLDSDKRIIKIEQDLSPASYPKSYCPAGSNASYVIELNAGQATATHMHMGQQLEF